MLLGLQQCVTAAPGILAQPGSPEAYSAEPVPGAVGVEVCQVARFRDAPHIRTKNARLGHNEGEQVVNLVDSNDPSGCITIFTSTVHQAGNWYGIPSDDIIKAIGEGKGYWCPGDNEWGCVEEEDPNLKNGIINRAVITVEKKESEGTYTLWVSGKRGTVLHEGK